MKTVSASLLSHIQGEVLTIALRLKLTRRDGVILGFTNHVEDVTISGVLYRSTVGLTPSEVQSSSNMAVDNLDVLAMIDDDVITEEDLLAGVYDFAVIEIVEFNYMDTTQGGLILRKGTLGEISVGAQGFKAELRGAMQPLQQVKGRIYQKRCDADLGDARCGVNIAAMTQTGAVTSVTNRGEFVVSGLTASALYFNGGLLTWTSGANNGLAMEVKLWTGSPDTIVLFLPMPFNVVVADTFTVTPGCDLTRETCRDKFSNIANFRGFPDLPTRDAVLAYPDAPG